MFSQEPVISLKKVDIYQNDRIVLNDVSFDISKGEFVYLIVQDKRNGKVITVIDNRTDLTVKQMAGDSKEGNEALQTLMYGGGSSKRN